MLSFHSRPKSRKPASERCRARLRLESLESRLAPARVIGWYPEWGTYARNFQINQQAPRHFPAAQSDELRYAFISPTADPIGHSIPPTDPRYFTADIFDPYAAVQKFFPGDPECDPAMCPFVRGNFNQLRILKEQFPDLTITMGIGGYTLSTWFSDIAASPALRQSWVTSIHDLMIRWASGPNRDQNPFDGIEIDWENPGTGGAPGTHHRPDDGSNYVLLLQELRRQFDDFGKQEGKTYKISAVVGAGPDTIGALDVPGLNSLTDVRISELNIDYHGAGWEPNQTNHNMPLFHNPADPSNLSVDASMQQLISGGLDPAKIDMAAPLYTRCWSGVGTANNGLYQSASGPCAGQFEAGIGDLNWLEDLRRQNPAGFPVFHDDVAKEPWIRSSAGNFYTYMDPGFINDIIDYSQANLSGNVFFWDASGDIDGPGSIIKVASDRLHGGASPSRSGQKGQAAALVLATPTLVLTPAATLADASLTLPAERQPVIEGQPGNALPDPLKTSRVTALSQHQQRVDQALASVLQEFELL